jgi:hypothetical protein
MTEIKTLSFERKIPVKYSVDVCVVGGGPAGVAATVTAARQGASVFLAEGHSCFGGLGTAGGVWCFTCFADGENFLAGGIGQEIYDRLWDEGGVSDFANKENPMKSLSFRGEPLKRIYDDMVEKSGAEFSFQTSCIGAEVEDGRISQAVFAAKSGIFAVEAKNFIDCSGDGDLSARAGAPFELGDKNGRIMPSTLVSYWSGFDNEKIAEASKGVDLPTTIELIEQAHKDGVFTVADRHHSGVIPITGDFRFGNVSHCFDVDGTDEKSITRALVEGRKIHCEYEDFYHKYFPGHEDVEIISSASLLGVRESRRIMGDYVLCQNDFEKQAVFEDEIGRYNFFIDIHPYEPTLEEFKAFQHRHEHLSYGKGESYGIPYRSLVPKNISNLHVAGRCISADQAMQSTTRVMPACYITGQAAGAAAAICSKKNISSREIDVKELQSLLKDTGAFLPNM